MLRYTDSPTCRHTDVASQRPTGSQEHRFTKPTGCRNKALCAALAVILLIPGQPVFSQLPAVANHLDVAISAALVKTHEAWAAGNYADVRNACDVVVASPDAPANVRSYASLRIAQSYEAERKPDLARAAYARIATNTAYLSLHRREASECALELEREAQGLPQRDPEASRTRLPAVAFAAKVFVSPQGSDKNNGSAAAPVASLTRARDLVRSIKAAGTIGAITVVVLPGEYRVTGPLVLSKQDSGTPENPVIYQAIQPGKAILYGGTPITGFQPVTDPAVLGRLPAEARGHVLQCDLKALGITDYGHLAVRGFGQPPSPPTLELYVNGQPMTLARWPKTGFTGIRKLVEPGSKKDGRPSVFEYVDERAARWTKAKDAWLFGYFHYLWADATIKISEIDPVAHTITAADAYQYGPPGMNNVQGIQYYAFNLLEELGRPGEWYLDRATGILYLYPPDAQAQLVVELNLLSTPMVTMEGVTDVRLEGLTFDLARFNGLVLSDCSRCLVARCTVSRMAGNGITINGGEADGLLDCEIHTIGRRATEVIGGDRATLKPGLHFVENCRLYNFGRIDRTYTPAIQLEGVGNRVAHNLIYDGPSSAMRIEGNDHLIEFNEIHDVVQESDDQGAIDLYGNPTYRGMVFRFNRFDNCGNKDGRHFICGQAAIRFDDAISGMLVYGNIFVRSANLFFGAVQINSGRDNIIENNLFVDCKQCLSGGYSSANSIWTQAATKPPPTGFILNDLYLQRYPELGTMFVEPGINHVWRNVFYHCGPVTIRELSGWDLFENGIFDKQDPGFADGTKGDYHIKPGAVLFDAVGFRPIPVDEIGLYAHN